MANLKVIKYIRHKLLSNCLIFPHCLLSVSLYISSQTSTQQFTDCHTLSGEVGTQTTVKKSQRQE